MTVPVLCLSDGHTWTLESRVPNYEAVLERHWYHWLWLLLTPLFGIGLIAFFMQPYKYPLVSHDEKWYCQRCRCRDDKIVPV